MNEQSNKQPYVRPVLKRVELKADEVLAAGCKTAVGGNPGSTSPTPCNSGCSTLGS